MYFDAFQSFNGVNNLLFFELKYLNVILHD